MSTRTGTVFRKLVITILANSLPLLIWAQAGNDNCANATTLTPGIACTTTTGDLQGATNHAPTGACGGATSTTTNDVWYRFTATSANATITVNNLGSNLTAATTYVEVLNGTCGSFTSIACQNVSTVLNLTTLVTGTMYYVRVYVTGSTTSGGNPNRRGFDICIQSSPNDNCGSAISLTSSTSCSNTAGALILSTATTGLPAGCEAGGTHYDVWYSFVAANTTHTATISSLGSNFSNPAIQLYSGTCGSLTSVQCGTTTLTATSLTIGNTYYVRVSNIGSAPATNGGFDICITHPAPPPANDNCSGAILLSTGTSCSNTSGTLVSATTSTGFPAGCAPGGTHYDVWYRFTAASTYELISLSGLGSNFTNPALQVYSGTCGSLTSIACGTTSLSVTGLTIGNTYYIRVSNVGSSISSNGGFSICVYHPPAANYDYGKSYINVTRNNGGGTINPGDTLEIRATLVIRSQSLDSLAFFDTLYNNSGVALIPGSLALRTNEGKVYKSVSDAFDTDEGYRYTNGLDTIIRINIGTGSSNVRRGRLTNTSKPSIFGSTCIIMATYRVVVYATYGATISVGGGSFTIQDGSTGIASILPMSARSAYVYSSPGLCPNAVSATNAIGGDFNGTFGAPSGGAPLLRNRGTSANVPGYIYMPFTTSGGPNDYYYAIANNTCRAFTTTTTWPKPTSSPAYRVFNVWDISGDHTGATNTAKGNPPCDTTQAISASNPCGYMLVINSAYKTDTAFQYTVSNLCPNTYYEISAWLKNVCYKCGCDSNGVGATGGSYIPTGTGDSSGVKPNIAFDIDGVDYYTTGNLQYQGLGVTQTGSDSSNLWVKRGFTYKTGPSQTSLTLTLRNNAPGGGGNDWAIDDIALATCSPDIVVTPGENPFVCDSNTVDVGAIISSYFDNYVYYLWEESTDNGATWNSTGVSGGPMSPTWNGSAWEYSVSYPSFVAYASDSGRQFRVVVASTVSNLSSSTCRFSNGASITLTVDPCDAPLNVDVLSFKGRNENNLAELSWITAKEEEPVRYEIQKSTDGSSFATIGEITGYKNPSLDQNFYNFTDPEMLNKLTWYRIKVVKTQNNQFKYSKVIQLMNNRAALEISSLINPFNNEIKFDIISPLDGNIRVEILDQYQHKLKTAILGINKGKNKIQVPNTGHLPSGIYILRVVSGNTEINRKIVKQN